MKKGSRSSQKTQKEYPAFTSADWDIAPENLEKKLSEHLLDRNSKNNLLKEKGHRMSRESFE